jgi:uncharacterized membrane protein
MEENTENPQEPQQEATTPNWVFLLFTAGLIVLVVGALFVFAASALGGNGSSSAGIVVFIGPVPIVFGAGPDAGLLILIGVIIAAISLVSFLVWRRRVIWD